MVIKPSLKDYLIAREMFGDNTKEQCNLVKKLKTTGITEPLCEGYSRITDKNKPDDIGWIIPNDCLE